MLGNSKCKVLSVLDLKDVFHSLRFSENSKKYCGILLYFGSSSYLYQQMPMGLNISPPIWQSYINAIMNCLQSKKYCEAIMDDLILFTPSKESHRLEAIQKLQPPGTPKGCRSFAGVVNFLSMFCPELQTLLKPIYDLTRKGRPYYWGKGTAGLI